MLAIGIKTNSMDSVKKSGMTAANMLDFIKTPLKKDKESTDGRMATDISENGEITCSTGRVYSCGTMIVFI